MKKLVVSAVTVLALSGCAGKVAYQQPESYSSGTNEKIINKSLDEAWASAVPALGKQFFVINNLDKSSGLINVSYSGSPEQYIDCGRIDSQVSNMRGQRHYNFPGASQHQQYEIMQNGHLFHIERKMKLDGRINLIFESVGKSQTKVTANTKYVVEKALRASNAAGGFPHMASDTISFNTGSGASFPGQGETSRCVATGQLEKQILEVIN